jgi:anti-anti-sigma regulatory factor
VAGRPDDLVVLVPGLLSARLEASAEAVLRVRLTGRAAGREAGEALAALLERVLGRAQAEQRVVVLHFEQMEGFDWAGIAALVRFFRAASEKGVSLTVVYDGTQPWQASSFESLRRALRSSGGPDVPFTRS